ncbi:HK97 family phage portal protein [Haloactinopolyspora alba]|uniref:HK97 family phage portal protein n=1 Tax=Haloactinopolyspora alba TaxID=648780 RepID=A0A2P8E079_9ACTN|nr:phage portal protein [Haloactinopolyspora alba]PSL02878.1 HK97 family phage portal protein [Haloactinopolyspora alba]
MQLPWRRGSRTDVTDEHVSISDPVLAAYFGVSPTYAGVNVDEGSVLGIPAMWRAVSLVAGTIAGLPLRTLRDTADGQRQRVSSWLDEPAGPNGQTPFEWKETIVAHLMLHGVTYLAHLFNNAGAVIGAVPIHPLAVTEEPQTRGVGDLGASQPRWTVTLVDGTQRQFTPATMTKILGLSLDGVHGMSVIRYGRNSFGTTIAGDRAAGRTFSNGAMLSGLVTPEEDVDEEEAKDIKAGLNRRMSGWENAGDIAFVNRNLKFTPWTMSAEDAQFLQSRQFQVEEISRWTGVPPHLLMQTEKQTSWGTGVAEQNRGLARFTLAGWTSRIEQRVSRLLQTPLFSEFDFAGLERPTPEQEIALLIQQVQAGLMTPNEARRIRNMPPIDGGDELRTAAAPAAAPAPNGQPQEVPA